MSEEYIADIGVQLRKINKNSERIADALEGLNKLFTNFMAMSGAKQIVQELKEEDLHVDTKVYDGLKVVQEVQTGKSKFTWYPIKTGGKVRACSNYPCPYFLKYNEDTGKYQHGKYDPEKQEWYYVSDICEWYGG